MKAIIYTEYGSPDVLRFTDAARPVPKDDQVLVKIRAAAINPLDWHFLRGTPHLLRLIIGWRRPKNPGLGVDLAGEVEAVGKNVTRFRPGDAVFGMCRGALAEYACAAERSLAPKPANVTFEQAAAVTVAAISALQGLRDKGRVQPGQRVLINGAAGGVGTFAVQLARWLGAEVTGVCSTRNADLVRSIGAHHVVDYTREDFTQGGPRFDLILDMIGNHSLAGLRRALTAKGVLVPVGAPDSGGWLEPLPGMIGSGIAALFMSQSLRPLLARLSGPDLVVLQELLQTGKIIPVIDRSYPLREAPDAIRYLETGRARGKIVITVPG